MNLPVGTRVRVSPPTGGHSRYTGRVGHIVARLPNGGYSVRLWGEPLALPFGSDELKVE